MKQLGLLDLLILVKKLNQSPHSLNKMVLLLVVHGLKLLLLPLLLVGFFMPLYMSLSFFVPTSIVALLHLILC